MAIIRTIEGAPVDYSPGVYVESAGGGRVGVDPSGAVKVRGAVLTDEGGYRNNFSGTSFFLDVGTCTFTNGSDIVTGTGFSEENMRVGDYIKLTADGDDKLARIYSIVTDTKLILEKNYEGTSATGDASTSKLEVKVGTGCSYTVGNGVFTAQSGTVSGSIFELERIADYTPLIKQSSVSISQRILNQVINIGLYDEIHTLPQYWCWFKFTGTDSSIVTCESAFCKSSTPSSYETETTQVKLPTSITTGQALRYRIECLVDKVRFLINGNLVAEHFKSIPNPYATLTSIIRITNTSTVGVSTTVNIDYDTVQNFNKIMTAPINDTDPPAATTNDMESLVNLLTQLVSRTAYPDALGRNRVIIETSSASNMSVNTAQVGGQNVATGAGLGGNGVARVTLSADSFSNGSQTYISAALPIIYNNISITA